MFMPVSHAMQCAAADAHVVGVPSQTLVDCWHNHQEATQQQQPHQNTSVLAPPPPFLLHDGRRKHSKPELTPTRPSEPHLKTTG